MTTMTNFSATAERIGKTSTLSTICSSLPSTSHSPFATYANDHFDWRKNHGAHS